MWFDGGMAAVWNAYPIVVRVMRRAERSAMERGGVSCGRDTYDRREGLRGVAHDVRTFSRCPAGCKINHRRQWQRYRPEIVSEQSAFKARKRAKLVFFHSLEDTTALLSNEAVAAAMMWPASIPRCSPPQYSTVGEVMTPADPEFLWVSASWSPLPAFGPSSLNRYQRSASPVVTNARRSGAYPTLRRRQ